MFTRTVIIIMDHMVMRLIMIIRRDLLRLDMAMVVIATSMSTGLTLITRLRSIIHKHITMDIIRDLLNQDMVITMDMDTLMFTRTVIIIMDLMDMRLIMIIRRDLLRLNMDTVAIATSMSTGLTLITRLRFIIQKHITMDMARGLLSLDMVT